MNKIKQRGTFNIEIRISQLKLTNLQLNIPDLLGAHQIHNFFLKNNSRI